MGFAGSGPAVVQRSWPRTRSMISRDRGLLQAAASRARAESVAAAATARIAAAGRLAYAARSFPGRRLMLRAS
jgi:hypothetical protein